MRNSTKVKLNIIRLLCIISLLITYFSIRNTYAKYYEKVDTNYEINIKRWLIKVNDTDIMSENNLTQIVSPTFIENENMNSNVWVPTAKAYIDIEIDYTEVDLSFDFDASIELLGENDKKLQDLKVTKITLVGENNIETEIQTPYIIEHEDNTTGENNNENKTKNIRIYFEWYDGEDNLMSDEDDTNYRGETQAGDSHTKVRYKVTLEFTQHIENNQVEGEDENGG